MVQLLKDILEELFDMGLDDTIVIMAIAMVANVTMHTIEYGRWDDEYATGQTMLSHVALISDIYASSNLTTLLEKFEEIKVDMRS